ncbi:carbohydrate kinase family protein [Candidatus Falkowbacteria bacterium]|nr:carbohydrate kinase family protein [Candidatus Falkowbacteria bacterium]
MDKTKKQFDVITIGGATRDIMFYSGDGRLITTNNITWQKFLAFEYGAKITADKLYFSFGGGAANTAVTFSKLGLKTAVICRLGNDDNGREILKNFKNQGIDTSFIKINKKETTGFSVILAVRGESHEHVVFGYRGANNSLNGADLPLSLPPPLSVLGGAKSCASSDLTAFAFASRLRSLPPVASRPPRAGGEIIETNWFYVSSLPKDTWEEIMKKLIATGKNIIWNPGGYQLKQPSKLKNYLPKIKLFILNHDEALEFKKLKDIRGLLRYIKGLGPQIAVITDGAKGAYVYDGKKYYYMKAMASKSVDTVGVGDAFSAAFTGALIYGKNIKTALAWGIKNSASVVSKIGAQNGILNKRQIVK